MGNIRKSKLIKSHWEYMSDIYGRDLKSTTKATTIKKLEIDSLSQAIKYIIEQKNIVKNVLEFGCGNGYNCCSLSKIFENIIFTGVDYIPNMINNAISIMEMNNCDNIKYVVGDILDIDKVDLLPKYDIVFTDRCIINLDSIEKQRKSIFNLANKVIEGGHLILIENILQTYTNQNSCRKLIGLDRRIPPHYNLFLDHDFIMECANELSLQLIDIHNFGSLHDIFLYVILPKINDGEVKYDSPIVTAITEFCIETKELTKNQFGEFGQNRLYLFRKIF